MQHSYCTHESIPVSSYGLLQRSYDELRTPSVFGVVLGHQAEAKAGGAHARALPGGYGQPDRVLHARLGLDAGKARSHQGVHLSSGQGYGRVFGEEKSTPSPQYEPGTSQTPPKNKNMRHSRHLPNSVALSRWSRRLRPSTTPSVFKVYSTPVGCDTIRQ